MREVPGLDVDRSAFAGDRPTVGRPPLRWTAPFDVLNDPQMLRTPPLPILRVHDHPPGGPALKRLLNIEIVVRRLRLAIGIRQQAVDVIGADPHRVVVRVVDRRLLGQWDARGRVERKQIGAKGVFTESQHRPSTPPHVMTA